MFLRHKEIFLMKNGTHYSLKDTDWLISFINYSVCFQLFSISNGLCSHFPVLRPMCFMRKVCFYILIGNIILHFGTLTVPFQYYLPEINGETPPIRRWQDSPPFPGVMCLSRPSILLPSKHTQRWVLLLSWIASTKFLHHKNKNRWMKNVMYYTEVFRTPGDLGNAVQTSWLVSDPGAGEGSLPRLFCTFSRPKATCYHYAQGW